MKAISRYRRAIAWIAQHDAQPPTQESLAVTMLHVALIAHVFEKDVAHVGAAVLEERRRARADVDTYPLAGDHQPRELRTGPLSYLAKITGISGLERYLARKGGETPEKKLARRFRSEEAARAAARHHVAVFARVVQRQMSYEAVPVDVDEAGELEEDEEAI